MARDLSKERLEACVPLAMEILKTLVAEHDLYMGERPQADLDKFFQNFFIEKVEPILRSADIKTADMAFIFQLILQPIDNLKNTTVNAINDAYDGAVAFKFGVDDVNDVRISDIVKVQAESMKK